MFKSDFHNQTKKKEQKHFELNFNSISAKTH